MLQPAHSILLPPSGAAIWFPCAGSSHAQKHLPDLYSLPAIEGVGAHMHAQACFNLNVDAERFQGPKRSFNGIEITNAQVEHVQEYVDLIRSRPGLDEHRFIELRMSLSQIHLDLFGTLDSGVYDWITNTLFIDDFKYGFDDVSAVDNPQLWIYTAMLVAYLFKQFKIKPKRIQLGIFQPRSYHGERESYQQITYEELVAWRDSTLTKAVTAAVDPNARRTPGSHCKHCKAKLNCPEYAEWSNYNIEPPFPLTDESIVKIMEVAPTFKKLHEDALIHGTERRQRGFDLPGTKLVRKIKHRILDDAQETIVDLLKAGASPDKIYKKADVKSPNQLEKALDKKFKPIIEKHTYTPRGDVVIALLKDNKPAIATTKEVFRNDN